MPNLTADECSNCNGYDSSTCPACLGTGEQPPPRTPPPAAWPARTSRTAPGPPDVGVCPGIPATTARTPMTDTQPTADELDERERRLRADFEDARTTLNRARANFDRIADELRDIRLLRHEMESNQ
ncbi:hypothetical protein [Kitasatospora fiedleri]|uniref:hypothetical protein n=1 Tax=Kitasatospora fiedleri TaxID=2991545 RepID=UPI00249A9758|nr:hypothetical protein [Kitasatospora fiedleri]